MKKVTLNLYNYGNITKVAFFGNNGHDAYICLKSLNENQVKGHGFLPSNVFYFLDYTQNKQDKVMVDYESNTYQNADIWKYAEQVKTTREQLKEVDMLIASYK